MCVCVCVCVCVCLCVCNVRNPPFPVFPAPPSRPPPRRLTNTRTLISAHSLTRVTKTCRARSPSLARSLVLCCILVAHLLSRSIPFKPSLYTLKTYFILSSPVLVSHLLFCSLAAGKKVLQHNSKGGGGGGVHPNWRNGIYLWRNGIYLATEFTSSRSLPLLAHACI